MDYSAEYLNELTLRIFLEVKKHMKNQMGRRRSTWISFDELVELNEEPSIIMGACNLRHDIFLVEQTVRVKLRPEFTGMDSLPQRASFGDVGRIGDYWVYVNNYGPPWHYYARIHASSCICVQYRELEEKFIPSEPSRVKLLIMPNNIMEQDFEGAAIYNGTDNFWITFSTLQRADSFALRTKYPKKDCCLCYQEIAVVRRRSN